MGLTATDGETEASAWSHRGSTHPVPSLCLLIVMHPKFSTQLYLAEDTLESVPLFFRGLQWSRGRKKPPSLPGSLGEFSYGHLCPIPCPALSLHPGNHPISSTEYKGGSG